MFHINHTTQIISLIIKGVFNEKIHQDTSRYIKIQTRIADLILIFGLLIISNIAIAEQDSPAVDAGYVLTTRIWPQSSDGTTDIPVCWVNPNAVPAGERDGVINAVADTWAENSLVTFTGWGTCPVPATDFAGIRITIEDVAGAPHVLGLGTRIMSAAGGMSLNFGFTNWYTNCPMDQGRSPTMYRNRSHS